MYNKQFMVINARRTPDKKQVRMKRYKVFDKRPYKVQVAALVEHPSFNDDENRELCIETLRCMTDKDKERIKEYNKEDIKTILHKGYMFYFVPE
jgi:hypothetical protein